MLGNCSWRNVQVVEVNGQRLLVVNAEGTFYVLSSQCPHRQAPLDQGRSQESVIECPWHNYRHSVITGENLYPRNVYPTDLTYLEQNLKPIPNYPVRVDQGAIFVKL